MGDAEALPATGGPVPYSSTRATPRSVAFPGSTDCHMHLFDDGVPTIPGAVTPHANATPSDYAAYRRTIGPSRCVVVQPSAYGFDNRATLAGVAALGDTARGVVVVPVDVSDGELRRLHHAGMRGVRFNLVQPGALRLEDAIAMAPRLDAIGWHIQFQLPRGGVAPILDVLSTLPVRLVFDHMGRVAGVDDPGMDALLRLVGAGRAWVKLSGPYLDATTRVPGYADRLDVARRLVRAAPDRMLWGSDWPHVTEADKPDDAELFDLLADWVPDEATRRAVLVDNPADLYGFARA